MTSKLLSNAISRLFKERILLVSVFILLLGLNFQASCLAQNWASIGRFNQNPNCVWYDAQVDRLYVAGSYTYFDSTEIHGFGYVVGDTVIGLGCGFDVGCGVQLPYTSEGSQVKGFARLGNTLYVTGAFDIAGGQVVNGIAKWQGNDWIPVGSGLGIQGTPSPGIGAGLEVMGNELYLYGLFDSINGVEAHGIAKFNGKHWLPVFDMPRFSATSPYTVFDAEWFQGELYVGGTFHDTTQNSAIHVIVKWNGSNWAEVGNGFIGDYPSVGKLLTYKNKLIIAGHFNRFQNLGLNPGNGITAWDGQNWDTLRGGINSNIVGGSIADIAVHQDELYVAGIFSTAGGVPSKSIAKWDGERWCGVWDNNSFGFRSIAFLNDTLFGALDYGTLGGQDSSSRFAKWIGGQLGDSCQLVGIEDPIVENALISIYPNPAQSHFSIDLPPNLRTCKLRIYDIAGREVMPSRKYTSGEIDVSVLASGLYFVEVQFGNRRQSLKLVKE